MREAAFLAHKLGLLAVHWIPHRVPSQTAAVAWLTRTLKCASQRNQPCLSRSLSSCLHELITIDLHASMPMQFDAHAAHLHLLFAFIGVQ